MLALNIICGFAKSQNVDCYMLLCCFAEVCMIDVYVCLLCQQYLTYLSLVQTFWFWDNSRHKSQDSKGPFGNLCVLACLSLESKTIYSIFTFTISVIIFTSVAWQNCCTVLKLRNHLDVHINQTAGQKSFYPYPLVTFQSHLCVRQSGKISSFNGLQMCNPAAVHSLTQYYMLRMNYHHNNLFIFSRSNHPLSLTLVRRHCTVMEVSRQLMGHFHRAGHTFAF